MRQCKLPGSICAFLARDNLLQGRKNINWSFESGTLIFVGYDFCTWIGIFSSIDIITGMWFFLIELCLMFYKLCQIMITGYSGLFFSRPELKQINIANLGMEFWMD